VFEVIIAGTIALRALFFFFIFVFFVKSPFCSGFMVSLFFSTVSTFVTEYNKINKTYKHHGKALFYVSASLLVACVLGLSVYAPLAVI